MQFQLDLLGGLAGDMYIAAVLDAFPEHREALVAAIEALQPHFGRQGGRLALQTHNDGIFNGSRFTVDEGVSADALHVRAETARDEHPRGGHRHDGGRGQGGHGQGDDRVHRHHDHDHDHDHDHGVQEPQARAADAHHVRWSDIRARLQAALAPGVLHHALGIFGALAEAEAEVHGVAVDAVEFHEVGAWDSIVDIVGAAWLIDALDARRWTVGPVPLGAGRIRTAHGLMPVPSPATALLLRGFATIDDGIAGERVTPTGAAILKHLTDLSSGTAGPPRGASARGEDAPSATGLAAPAEREPSWRRKPEVRVLRRSGIGFGTRRLDGVSNCVRLLAFDDPTAAAPPPAAHRELTVVEFEVDDQSAEDLAMGLDRLRVHPGVFDVVQAPVFGKKGRMMTSVRLLARPADLDAVLDACFRETTTIGLRHTTVRGKALPRRSDDVMVEGHRMRVKTVERPGGPTAKAESDDALAHETHRRRRLIRHEAERLVLQDVERRGRDE